METRTELREALAKAGSLFDGRVTHGSLNAQMLVVEDAIAKALADDSAEYFFDWDAYRALRRL